MSLLSYYLHFGRRECPCSRRRPTIPKLLSIIILTFYLLDSIMLFLRVIICFWYCLLQSLSLCSIVAILFEYGHYRIHDSMSYYTLYFNLPYVFLLIVLSFCKYYLLSHWLTWRFRYYARSCFNVVWFLALYNLVVSLLFITNNHLLLE